MRPLTAGASGPLLRAIAALVQQSEDISPPRLTVEEIETRDWASATFIGATHRLALRIDGPPGSVRDAMSRLEEVGEIEIAVPGHIVADVALVRGTMEEDRDCVTQSFTITALVVED